MSERKQKTMIRLNDVRLSFPSLHRMQDWKNGREPRYEATFILDKIIHDKEIKQIDEQINDFLKDWNIKRPLSPTFKICFKDGDLQDKEEYQGAYILKATSKHKVPYLDQFAKPLKEGVEIFYGGCYVSAYIKLDPYDKSGKGITSYLKSVQFRKDGERFGGSFMDYDPVEAVDMEENDKNDEDLF